MKKFMSVAMAAVMIASQGAAALAQEDTKIPEKVEVSFRVGDSSLLINGNSVEVETPYIAGEGTTLVPLRVITEAFGASVTWVNETKEIILEYPDVNIKLQIGNKNATVNNHTEELPEAPVLSPNGVTMVPLRFISETFGATVGYDNATAAITVVKENEGENSTISSSTDLPNIGDSYWNWSMMTPSDMMMTERYTDGSYTAFEGDDDSYVTISIYPLEYSEEYEYDTYYKSMKDSWKSSLTLSKDEKKKDDNGNDYFRLVGRDKEYYYDTHVVYTNGNAYRVSFSCVVGSEKIRSYTAVLDSFKSYYTANDVTHDLSNVDNDGYRLVKDDSLKISFKVPADLSEIETDALDVVAFVSNKKNDYTSVSVGVYSKSEDCSARSAAIEDRNIRALYANTEKVTVSEVGEYTKQNIGENAYYYTYVTKNLAGGDEQMCDIFFEKGNYVYNVTVVQPAQSSGVLTKVMDTLTVEELDEEEFGVVLKNSIEKSEYKTSADDWEMQMRSPWEEVSVGSMSTNGMKLSLYKHSVTNSVMQLYTMDTKMSNKELAEFAQTMYDEARRSGKTIEKLFEGKTGSNAYFKYTIYVKTEKDKENNVDIYDTVYILKFKNKLVMCVLAETEEFAFSESARELEECLGTFKFVY